MNIIVNVDSGWGIGYDGHLLEKIAEDFKFFRDKTIGKIIILGRKTLETFPDGKPLKDRINVIMTNDKSYTCEGTLICNSINDLFRVTENYNTDDLFVVGGESIYSQLLPYCSTAYVTKIYRHHKADRYFPDLDKHPDWVQIDSCPMTISNGTKYNFNTYRNIKLMK